MTDFKKPNPQIPTGYKPDHSRFSIQIDRYLAEERTGVRILKKSEGRLMYIPHFEQKFSLQFFPMFKKFSTGSW